LDVEDIWDAWKGVYYFWVDVDAGGTGPWGSGDLELGKVYQINFRLHADYEPPDFVIPPALIGIKDSDGHASMIYGKAKDLKIEQLVPSYVDLTGARIANTTEKADFELKLATGDDAAIEAAFENLRPIGYSKTTVGNNINIDYALPSYVQTMPWYDNIYEKFTYYVITKSVTSIQESGYALVTYRPKLTYTDHFGRTKVSNGQYRAVAAHGPAIVAQPMLKGISVGNLKRSHLTADAKNVVKAEILVPNVGDDIAQDPRITAVMPHDVTLVSSDPEPVSYNPTTREVVWELFDIAPYSGAKISLTIYTTPPMPAQPIEMFTLIDTIDAEFVHLYLQQLVTSDSVGPPALDAQNLADLESPGAPVLDPIVSPTNQVYILVTGSSEPDALVEIIKNGVPAGSGTANANGRFGITIILVEGDNVIAARATDSLNNGPGPISTSQTVILDTTPPLAPVLDEISSITTSASQIVTGTSEPFAYVEVFINGGYANDVYADDAGFFTTDVVLVEGLNVINARAKDYLGNGPGPYSEPLNIKLDSTSPTKPVLYQLPGSTTIDRIEVSGESEPDAEIEIFVNDVSTGTVIANDNGAFRITVALSDGENIIMARATDALGNGPGALSEPVKVLYSMNLDALPVAPVQNTPRTMFVMSYVLLILIVALLILLVYPLYRNRRKKE